VILAAATPVVDELITSIAEAVPAIVGVNVICTVQLFCPLTLLSVVPQLVAEHAVVPQVKLAAFVPLIW
jgi:hypothetical protein